MSLRSRGVILISCPCGSPYCGVLNPTTRNQVVSNSAFQQGVQRP
ncbi:hypothetical protein [Bradyrhizobium sp. CSA112]|nr:hypothetical protein [Bradyrhizobium sp. CSA112]